MRMVRRNVGGNIVDGISKRNSSSHPLSFCLFHRHDATLRVILRQYGHSRNSREKSTFDSSSSTPFSLFLSFSLINAAFEIHRVRVKLTEFLEWKLDTLEFLSFEVVLNNCSNILSSWWVSLQLTSFVSVFLFFLFGSEWDNSCLHVISRKLLFHEATFFG